MILSWISLKGDFSDGESSKVVIKIKLTIFEYWHLHMTDLFKRCGNIPSCPWIKQSNLGKCRNGKLLTSSLVNDRTLRSTQRSADFTSVLSSVNNVKISDLLEFLVMLFFSSLCSHPRLIFRMLQDYENIHGESLFHNLKKPLVSVSFHFSLQLCKNILEWLLCYWSYLLP